MSCRLRPRSLHCETRMQQSYSSHSSRGHVSQESATKQSWRVDGAFPLVQKAALGLGANW